MERAQLASLLSAAGCVTWHGGQAFLTDPHWGNTQRDAFAAVGRAMRAHCAEKPMEGWLCIPTGGSSGGLRFARHDEGTLGAAVTGFCQHFDLARVNAVDVLPPWHVSGLMARVRCAATRGKHVRWDWKALSRGDFPRHFEDGDWVFSLVPTQLQRLLHNPDAAGWLRSFRLILLGGGPMWADLWDRALSARLPVVASYGMTETAAMVAAQRQPLGDAAMCGSGQPLPHVRITLVEPGSGEEVGAGGEGLIRVEGASLMRGYWGSSGLEGSFDTADLGRWDERGNLHVLGRRDAVILTGGENVNPLKVEAELRRQFPHLDFGVLGLPDEEWGERVVACYRASKNTRFSSEGIDLSGAFSPAEKPKAWVRIAPEDWPRNAQGKLNRARLREIASTRVDPSGEGR